MEDNEERKQLKEKLLVQEKELADLKTKYEVDKKIMVEHITDLMREMKRIDEVRRKLSAKRHQSDHAANKKDSVSDESIQDDAVQETIKLYSSSSNVVVVKDDSRDSGGGHLDMDLLSYYCTGPMSGGRKEKPVVRTKAMTNGEYHVWFENKEDAEDVVNKERHVFLGRMLTMKHYVGQWPLHYSMMVSNTSDEVANLDYLTRYFRSSKYGSGDETFVGVEMMTGEHGDTIAKVTFKDPYLPIALKDNPLNSLKLGEEVQVEVCSLATPNDVPTATSDGDRDQSSPSIPNIPKPVSESGRLPLKSLLADYFRKYPEILDELVKEAQLSVSMDGVVAVIQPIKTRTSDDDAVNNELPQLSVAEAVKRFRLLVLNSVSYLDVDDVPITAESSGYSRETKQCEEAKIMYKFQQNCVSLVGGGPAVLEMVRIIEKKCKRSLHVTEECFLDPEDYAFFINRGHERVPTTINVKILKNDVDWSLLVTGFIDDVHQFKYQLLPTFLSHINLPTNITSNGCLYLRGKKRTWLKSIVVGKGIAIFFTPPDGVQNCRLMLLCSNEEAVELAKRNLRNPLFSFFQSSTEL